MIDQGTGIKDLPVAMCIPNNIEADGIPSRVVTSRRIIVVDSATNACVVSKVRFMSERRAVIGGKYFPGRTPFAARVNAPDTEGVDGLSSQKIDCEIVAVVPDPPDIRSIIGESVGGVDFHPTRRR